MIQSKLLQWILIKNTLYGDSNSSINVMHYQWIIDSDRNIRSIGDCTTGVCVVWVGVSPEVRYRSYTLDGHISVNIDQIRMKLSALESPWPGDYEYGISSQTLSIFSVRNPWRVLEREEIRNFQENLKKIAFQAMPFKHLSM